MVFFQETYVFPNYYQQYLKCELATFDNNLTVDVTGVFLDISEAFDQVWHDGPLFKFKKYGVEGELLSLLKHYFQNLN